MLKNLPKNLIPKMRQSSITPHRILEIMEDVLDNPIKIPNYLHRDSPFDDLQNQTSSFNNSKNIASYQYVDPMSLNRYFNNYHKNKKDWENTPFQQKKEVFLNAADLIENKYYHQMLAYTMVGQNKNVYEAEIDSICELVDFLRFNVSYAENIIDKQPISINGIDNISEYNSLNGFVASITPFNFTAIGGNLATVPLLFGNSVLWKPSDNAILSNHLFYQIMLEAGLPNGVLNFCPMEPNLFLNMVAKRNDLGALLFTGSSKVFDDIHTKVMSNMENRNTYPRLIGETGGKNFHFVDDSCIKILDEVVLKTIESSFNYSGQKCSACSIMYVPEKLLPNIEKSFRKQLSHYNDNLKNYGVINRLSYDRINNYFNKLKEDDTVQILFDTGNNDSNEYFISPKVLICKDHQHELYHKELFAPILTIYPYKDKNETMDLCVNGNSYSLTGSIFSLDNNIIELANEKFKHKTGNFYINDKSTCSVVGQQPFGGSGKSGTNDKAGDINLLFRLLNQRNLKIDKNIKTITM